MSLAIMSTDRTKELLLLLLKKTAEIALAVQIETAKEQAVEKVMHSVAFNQKNQTIYVRMDVWLPDTANSLMFENDIISVELISAKAFFIKCSLYSDYGIDNLVSASVNITSSDFKIINDDAFEALVAGIKEHIWHYVK